MKRFKPLTELLVTGVYFQDWDFFHKSFFVNQTFPYK